MLTVGIGPSTASYLELELIPHFDYRIPADAELQSTTWHIYPCWTRKQQILRAKHHKKPFVESISTDPRPTGKSVRWWRAAKSAVRPSPKAPSPKADTIASGAGAPSLLPPAYTLSDRGEAATMAMARGPTDARRAFRDRPPPASASLTYHEAYLQAWSWQLGRLNFSHPTLRGPILLRLWRGSESVVAFGARREGVTPKVRECLACGEDTSKWCAEGIIKGHVKPVLPVTGGWRSSFTRYDSHVADFIAANSGGGRNVGQFM